MTTLKTTPLHAAHQRAGAKLVDFAGWEMPLHYGSQMEEHKRVRESAGMFDVSHMQVVDIHGPQAQAFLRYLLANDVAKLKTEGRALYSCMLNEAGGVIDDLIIYWTGGDTYRAVVNAATAEGDIAHMQAVAKDFDVNVEPRPEFALIAIQGPQAVEKTLPLLPADLRNAGDLKPFSAVWNDKWFVARTGYTGEDGFEVMLPAEEADDLWEKLKDAGVHPIGLGARDTLRLEAGMNLYGTDMDDQTNPLTANLGWTIALKDAERDFIGRAPIEQSKAEGVKERMVGLVLDGRGVLRGGTRIETEAGDGVVTSGSFAPSLGVSVAFARIPAGVEAEQLHADIRGRKLPVRVVKPVFVRNGEPQIDLPKN
ncbi:glycine cleavage system protein T [Thioalkalivibrio versutus]|uniref:Aminomethyltransferase n=1 Tax=Thioalkalivibrio versutus TaxID=106634 RepID=A0A0G3G6V6_9GAMM|nr:glycine cleavage system aminomethyltransferase GcvT [Thioalkalivibrio versutus]AKJ94601.1 glycine cleavage system protein T [Thioalkalivibrio versutus]